MSISFVSPKPGHHWIHIPQSPILEQGHDRKPRTHDQCLSLLRRFEIGDKTSKTLRLDRTPWLLLALHWRPVNDPGESQLHQLDEPQR